MKVIPPYEGDLDLVGVRNIADVLNSGGEKAVVEIKDCADSEGALIKTRLEEGHHIHEKIVEVAESERCDLIVMGKSVKKGLRKLFGGNTLNRVLGSAPCPVLVVEA